MKRFRLARIGAAFATLSLAGCFFCGSEPASLTATRTFATAAGPATVRVKTFSRCNSHGNHFIGAEFRDHFYATDIEFPERAPTPIDVSPARAKKPDRALAETIATEPRSVVFAPGKDRFLYRGSAEKNWRIYHFLPGGGPAFRGLQDFPGDFDPARGPDWRKVSTSVLEAAVRLASYGRADEPDDAYWAALKAATGTAMLDTMVLNVATSGTVNSSAGVFENLLVRARPDSKVNPAWRKRLDDYLSPRIRAGGYLETSDLECCVAAAKFCSARTQAIQRLLKDYLPEAAHYSLLVLRRHLSAEELATLARTRPHDKIFQDYLVGKVPSS